MFPLKKLVLKHFEPKNSCIYKENFRFIFQRLALEVQKLPKVQDNSSYYENYTFTNIRKRDKHKKEIDALREKRNLCLERLSQEANYTKKRKPNYDARICYKSDVKPVEEEEEVNECKTDDDDDDDDDDEKEKLSFFNESVNLKSKEAGVFLPLDVYDKGNLLF